MSQHDCNLFGFDIAIKPEIKQDEVIQALRDFADNTGRGFDSDSVTLEDGTLEFDINFYSDGGGASDDNVRDLAQTLDQMISGRGAMILRDYDTGDYESTRIILGLGANARERRLGVLDFHLAELSHALSDRLSPDIFDAQFAQPLRAAVSATYKQGEDNGREDDPESPEGT